MATQTFRTSAITWRWCLTERRARWLCRSIPDHPWQVVMYRKRRIGYRVDVEDRYPVKS